VKRTNKDKGQDTPLNKNEFTLLNRNQYYDLIVGREDIALDNWEHSFSKIFIHSGWDISRIRSYLKIFQDFHLKASHNRTDVFENFDQSNIYQFIIDSAKIIIIINRSYFIFLERVKKAEIPGSKTIGYYFYLDGGTLQPVLVSQTNREKIIELFKDSKTTNRIDFSCPSDLEERFGINYQELFAILYDLLSEMEITKKNGPLIDFRLK
jgi:hypothetical protein